MATGAIRYGFGYQGSKNKICRWLMEHLPRGKRFVDLFGGGFAVSHAALLSGKYKTVYYNELNANVVEIVRRYILNCEPVPKEWISREDFFRLKDENPLIKLFWSFNKTETPTYIRRKSNLGRRLCILQWFFRITALLMNTIRG